MAETKKAAPAKTARTGSKPSAKSTAKKAAPAKKAPAAKKALAKKAPAAKSPATRDPKGGLTAAGRKMFAEKEGAHLRPGVQGEADTPDKMVRKGSFLRRHFANPRGPMERDGKPTRLALSAQAWGEPLPKNEKDAKKLADKGHALLEQYHEAQEGGKAAVKTPGRKTPAKKTGGKAV